MNKKQQTDLVKKGLAIAGGTVLEKVVEKGVDVVVDKVSPTIKSNGMYEMGKGIAAAGIGFLGATKADKISKSNAKLIQDVSLGVIAGGVSTATKKITGGLAGVIPSLKSLGLGNARTIEYRSAVPTRQALPEAKTYQGQVVEEAEWSMV